MYVMLGEDPMLTRSPQLVAAACEALARGGGVCDLGALSGHRSRVDRQRTGLRREGAR